MAYRMYNDEKIKILLLYLLKELDQKLDFQTISEIIVWDGSINYFVFTDCFNKLVENGSMAACREKGLIRSEGKDYVMKDGDITLFRFNV